MEEWLTCPQSSDVFRTESGRLATPVLCAAPEGSYERCGTIDISRAQASSRPIRRRSQRTRGAVAVTNARGPGGGRPEALYTLLSQCEKAVLVRFGDAIAQYARRLAAVECRWPRCLQRSWGDVAVSDWTATLVVRESGGDGGGGVRGLSNIPQGVCGKAWKERLESTVLGLRRGTSPAWVSQ